MSKTGKVLLTVLGTLVSLFAVTFAVYLGNLDMKLLSKIEPLLLKHYDNLPRDKRL